MKRDRRERFNERVEVELYPIDGATRERIDSFFGQRIGQISREDLRARIADLFPWFDPADVVQLEAAYFTERWPFAKVAKAIDAEIDAERAERLDAILNGALRRAFGAPTLQPVAPGETDEN